MEKIINFVTPIRDLIPPGETEVIEVGQHRISGEIVVADQAEIVFLDGASLVLEADS